MTWTDDKVDPKVMGDFLPVLRVADRCDRCIAQARVRVRLQKGSSLVFCAHHYSTHEPALKDIAIAIRDDRAQLTVRETEPHS